MIKRVLLCMAFCILFLLPEEALSAEPPQPPVSETTGGLSSSEDSRLALSRAWKYFDSEKFDHSARFFKLAEEYPENRFEARFGLGLSYMKLGRKEEAIEEFSFLVENDYKTEEALPPMMWLLLDIKDYERAGQYLPLVKEGKQKRQWRKMIGSGPFTLDAEPAIKNNDPEAIISAVNKYKHLLASCSAPYTFFNSSRVLSENEIKILASEIYADLLKYCKRNMELRALVFNELVRIETPAEISERLSTERVSYSSNPDHLKKLDRIEASILTSLFNKTQPSSGEAYDIFGKIYALSSEDESALSMISWSTFNRKEYDMAFEGFSTLSEQYPENSDYALGMGYVLLAMGKADEALQVVLTSLRGNGLTQENRIKLLELRDLVLWQKHDSATPSSHEALLVTEELYASNPEDDAVLSMLSWERFNLKQYEKAHEGFTSLTGKYPDNPDYALGLVYTLMALGRHEDALDVSESFKGESDDFKGIMANANAGIARAAFKDKDYGKAVIHFQKVLDADPENDEALSLIAWGHYNMGNVDEALPLFQEKYSKGEDPDYVPVLLSIYETTDPQRAIEFERSLRRKGNTAALRALGDFHFQKGRVISAAQVSSDSPKTCYYNADSPSWEANIMTRAKTGDAGLSKLNETKASLSASYPVSEGGMFGFSIRRASLSSGSASDGVFAGSYYKGIPQIRSITTSATLLEPEIRFRQEGPVSYGLALGTTPSGGEVREKPTFSFEAKRSNMKLEVHQSPVRESILSYSGLQDPYGTDAWGRVVMRGFKGSVSFTPKGKYLLYVEAGYDNFSGSNVIENRAYNGTIVFGKSIPGKKTDMFVAGAMTMMAFDKNTNYYTFGHGGYFSPQSFLAIGPSVRISSKPCKTLWFDASASVSYISHSTDSTPQYPLHQSIAPGEFDGESFTGSGFNLKGEARKLLAKKWSLGASFSYDNSADYTQWQTGIGLRYLMDGRTAVSP